MKIRTIMLFLFALLASSFSDGDTVCWIYKKDVCSKNVDN